MEVSCDEPTEEVNLAMETYALCPIANSVWKMLEDHLENSSGNT